MGLVLTYVMLLGNCLGRKLGGSTRVILLEECRYCFFRGDHQVHGEKAGEAYEVEVRF